MNLKGHSKFKLELSKNSKGYRVTKSADKKPLAKRLQKQADKQHSYYSLIASSDLKYFFEVPKIISNCSSPSHEEPMNFSFVMDFYNGKTILDILEYGDITQLNDFIDKLFMYLRWEFDNSEEIYIGEALQNKLLDLQTKIEDKTLSKIILDLSNLVLNEKFKAPVGYCHGDFTFSNMIFSNKIILIDWLNSFIESPIQDCAKLLQELNLQWSLLMDNPESRDITKIKIGYEHLRWEITQRLIHEYPQYLNVIELFYKITILRIIPYTKKEDKIYNILIKEIGGWKK